MSKHIWNKAASTYADVLDGQFTQAIGPTLDAAQVGSGAKVLDVGTGPGSIAAAARDRGAHAVGVDYAEDMIRTARKLSPDIEFRVTDATDLPFAQESFDSVVMGFTLFLIPDPQRALEEAFRVLVPGGRIAFTVWDDGMPGHRVFGAALAKHTGQAAPFGDLPLLGESDHDVFAGLVHSAGFENAQVDSLPIYWEVESSSQIFDAFAPMYDLTALSSLELDAFRRDVASNAESFRQGNRFAIPFPALLVSARKA